MLPSADLTVRVVAFFVPAIVPAATVSVVRESGVAKSISARATSRSLSAAALRSAMISFFLGAGEAGEAFMGVVVSSSAVTVRFIIERSPLLIVLTFTTVVIPIFALAARLLTLVCFPPPSSSKTLSNVAVTLAQSYGLGVIVSHPVTLAWTQGDASPGGVSPGGVSPGRGVICLIKLEGEGEREGGGEGTWETTLVWSAGVVNLMVVVVGEGVGEREGENVEVSSLRLKDIGVWMGRFAAVYAIVIMCVNVWKVTSEVAVVWVVRLLGVMVREGESTREVLEPVREPLGESVRVRV